MFKTIQLKESTKYNTVILNRPKKLNAISSLMVNELHELLVKLKNEQAKVLLLQGAGSSFSAGQDVSSSVSFANMEEAKELLSKMQEITKMIVQYPAPVIAAIHGYTLGAGYEIALNCDLVYASEDTVIRFPELEVGLSITQGSSHLLPRATGLMKAKELVFFGEKINAKSALELGLVNEIFKKEEFQEKVIAKAETLGARSISSLNGIKQLMNKGVNNSLEESLLEEVVTLSNLLS